MGEMGEMDEETEEEMEEMEEEMEINLVLKSHSGFISSHSIAFNLHIRFH